MIFLLDTMRRKSNFFYFSRIINLLEDINNKKNKPSWSTILNTVILAIAIIALITANLSNKEMQALTQQSVDSAAESARMSNDALNETRKLVEWAKPEPNVTLNSNMKWIGKNNSINLRISPYSPKDGIKNGCLIKPTKLELMFFNSGNAPVAFSAINIRFVLSKDSKNLSVFPFKLSRVETPEIKLYYNKILMQMYETFDFEYPVEAEGEVQYMHINEKNVFGFPPSFIHGEVMFRALIDSYSSIYAKNDWGNTSGIFKIGSFGPFEIGAIEAGEYKDVQIEVFACVEDFWGELFGSDPNYTTKQNMYASGNLIVEFEASNYDKVEYIFPLRSYFYLP